MGDSDWFIFVNSWSWSSESYRYRIQAFENFKKRKEKLCNDILFDFYHMQIHVYMYTSIFHVVILDSLLETVDEIIVFFY